MLIIVLILMLVLLMVSAFLSLAETALIGLSKLRLHHLVAQKTKHAEALQHLITKLDELITALLMANNFVNTAISSLGAALFIAWLGPEWGIPAATILVGTTILVFGEISPKVFAIRYAEPVALRVTPILRIILRSLSPFSRRFMAISSGLLKALGVEMTQRSPLISEEELKLMIELGKEQGVLGEHERKMLHRIFEFGDLKVKEVMIPRSQMTAVHDKATHDEVLTVLTEEGRSRIPVYGNDPNRIVGVIYSREILHIWREGWLIVLQDLIHPPYEISPEMRVTELLHEFQKRKIQIAIVVDQHGKTLGLVTLEDLIEEIVGEMDEKQAG